jgi:hypothetical protein
MSAHPDDDELDILETEDLEEEGPDVADLDDDPAYNPQDEGLKEIKGG